MTIEEAKIVCQQMADHTSESYTVTVGYDDRDQLDFVCVPTSTMCFNDEDLFTCKPSIL